MTNLNKLQHILTQFDAPIRYCFAYGSSIFKQTNNTPTMTDIIFGVTHSEHWHSLNLRQNPNHYSTLMRCAGSKLVTRLQHQGAGLYYHPYISCQGMNIKYGVVQIDTIERDLIEWDTLYLAGRLQKPTLVLRDCARIKLANKQNLYNAVRTALFLLPQEFTEEELFLKICGLSYLGDPRMSLGENPHKVFNIVYAQMNEFKSIYQSIIDDLPIVNYINENRLQQDDNPKLRINQFKQLPKNLTSKILCKSLGLGYKPDDNEQFNQVLSDPNFERYLSTGVSEIVSNGALFQSLKGVLTAGLSRSIFYMYEKTKKRFGV